MCNMHAQLFDTIKLFTEWNMHAHMTVLLSSIWWCHMRMCVPVQRVWTGVTASICLQFCKPAVVDLFARGRSLWFALGKFLKGRGDACWLPRLCGVICMQWEWGYLPGRKNQGWTVVKMMLSRLPCIWLICQAHTARLCMFSCICSAAIGAYAPR